MRSTEVSIPSIRGVLVDDSVEEPIGNVVGTHPPHPNVAPRGRVPDAVDGGHRRDGERHEPVPSQEDTELSRAYLLLEGRVAAAEHRRLGEHERVVEVLIGLRTNVAADVVDGQRVDAEDLGHRVQFRLVGLTGADPRRPGGLAGRRQVVVPLDAVRGEDCRVDHVGSPTAHSVRPTISPVSVSPRPGYGA
jgi:hypothetical protein